MKVMKLIILMAITMAFTITLTMKKIDDTQEQKSPLKSSEPALHDQINKPLPLKRVSRFLAAQEKNPRAADHCKNDNEICYILEGRNSTCCNNKCMDLRYDNQNCGACKKKCKFTDTCCRGECVSLAYDKRHCGQCNNRCMPGGYCIYGICDYA